MSGKIDGDDDQKVILVLKERIERFLLAGMDDVYFHVGVPYMIPVGVGTADARMRSLRLIKEAAEELIEEAYLKKL